MHAKHRPGLAFLVQSAIAGLLAAAACPAIAQAEQTARVDELLAMDFGRLLDLQVISATRSEELAFGLPAALAVLTREDIRRSGHRHLADLLRDVPGLHVGRWDANKWAISSRNALSRFASTLLVMVDGRPVYTPLSGGVRWEVLEMLLDDIERIEVVRGPGGPLWGANAVDGVISVVTRKAADTQGDWLDAVLAQGGEWRRQLGLRHGAAGPGGSHWRLSAQSSLRRPGDYAAAELSSHRGQRQPGSPARDGGESHLLALRVDGDAQQALSWSLQAQRSRSRYDEERASPLRPLLANRMRYEAGHLMGEWLLRQPAGQGRLRISWDQLETRDDILRDDQRILDIDLQWSARWGEHQWTLGGGWRDYRSDYSLPVLSPPCSVCFGAWPAQGGSRIASLFAQDQWRLSPNWQLTGGVKLERHEPGHNNVQPTLRLAYTPSSTQTAWASLTRAARAPNRLERDQALYNVPPAQAAALGCTVYLPEGICPFGQPDVPPWQATVAELGWRAQLAGGLELDLSAFHSAYRDMPVSGINRADRMPRLQGLESSLRWQWRRDLQLRAQLSLHEGKERDAAGAWKTMHLLPRSDGLLQLRWTPSSAWDLDLRAQRVGSMTRSNAVALPAHWRLDARAAWRSQPGWEWWIAAQRLNRPRAVEYFETLKVNTVASPGLLIGLRVAP